MWHWCMLVKSLNWLVTSAVSMLAYMPPPFYSLLRPICHIFAGLTIEEVIMGQY